MYEQYWQLTGKPFSQRIQPASLYRSKSFRTALLRLKYGCDNLAGPALILGLPGTGKTSLAKMFAEEQPSMRPFVHVVFPALECSELLRLLALELSPDGTTSAAGTDEVFQEIRKSLRHHAALEQRPLICFDDAHLLSDDALQHVVQPLLNLSETDSAFEMTVFLAGQPVLASQLRKLSSLSERIAVITPLSGFSETETADYVTRSLEQFSGRSDIFTERALQRLFEVTAGNPRRINRLCDMVLLVSCAQQLTEITESQINAVSTELMATAA